MSVRDDARSTRSAVGSANGHCKPTSHIQSSYRVLWRSYQETGHSLFESQKRENGIVRTSRDNLRSPLIPTYFGDPHFLRHIFAIASAYAPLMRDRSTKSTRQHHLFPHVVTTMSVVHILWNMAINDTVARFRGQVVSAAEKVDGKTLRSLRCFAVRTPHHLFSGRRSSKNLQKILR
jgi:hypothetical protein